MACTLFVTWQFTPSINQPGSRGSWSRAPLQRLSKYSCHAVRKTRGRCLVVNASGDDKRVDSAQAPSNNGDNFEDWESSREEFKSEEGITNNGDSDKMVEGSTVQANEEQKVQESINQATGESTQTEFGGGRSVEEDNIRVDGSSDDSSDVIQLTGLQPNEMTRKDIASKPDSNDLNETASGGLFKLSTDQPPVNEILDERTKQITSAWTNESGYLIGIGIIVLIGCFYVYAWTHQGGRY
jgi:hypothetical protein